MNSIFATTATIAYEHALKPLLFLADPEDVHDRMTSFGETLGSLPPARSILASLFRYKSPRLRSQVAGITFENPIGLAAGFDYEAKLTNILYSVGFGFQTVGTITNEPYEGNRRPRLGRLPKSKALMVNKGFKNPGAAAVIRKLNGHRYAIPLAISIGRTNSHYLKSVPDSIADIVDAFSLFECSPSRHTHYELNISCPNLLTEVSFYEPAALDDLLREIDALDLERPVFIKMPIEKDDTSVRGMLDVIMRHRIAGVIFGNLQKNRKDPSLVESEVKKFKTGNFSGKPTQKRSDELIELAYRHCKGKLIVIGCGGIFTAEDAYRKIRLGASLVQMITGMIFRGPGVIGLINRDLDALLKRDGFRNIAAAVGVDAIQ
jgi:dihydroorotate dehydrogenase subfamily 2